MNEQTNESLNERIYQWGYYECEWNIIIACDCDIIADGFGTQKMQSCLVLGLIECD